MKQLRLGPLLALILTACGGGGGGNTPAPTTAPTLSKPADLSLNRDASSAPIAFTVADAETPAEALTVTAESSNPALVGTAGLKLGGSGGSRSLVLEPNAGQGGLAEISLTVRDAQGLSTMTRFRLDVSATRMSFRGFAGKAYAQAAEAEPAELTGLEFSDESADEPGAYDTLVGP